MLRLYRKEVIVLEGEMFWRTWNHGIAFFWWQYTATTNDNFISKFMFLQSSNSEL